MSLAGPGDEPVWFQLARRFINHSNLQAAQMAAAALTQQAAAAHHLTSIHMEGVEHGNVTGDAPEVDPVFLAGRTWLQHLILRERRVLGGAAGVAQLLSHLQFMKQLEQLCLANTLWPVEEAHA